MRFLQNDNEQFDFLFSIAYKMTGNTMDSEDIVQEVLEIWERKEEKSAIVNEKKYLAKAIKNRTLSFLEHQERQKASYIGTFLPEPILKEAYKSIDNQFDLNFGWVVLLSKLSPTERAIFILKESFDLTYEDLAEIFDFTEENCRQLYHRAKEKVQANKNRFSPNPTQKMQIALAFQSALTTGNLESLIDVLKKDIVVYSDGGGKRPSAINPVIGNVNSAKFLLGLYGKFFEGLGRKIISTFINHCPSALVYEANNQTIETVLILDCTENQVNDVFIIRNPEKIHT